MDTKMIHTARAKLANAIRRRNQSAAAKVKRKILAEGGQRKGMPSPSGNIIYEASGSKIT